MVYWGGIGSPSYKTFPLASVLVMINYYGDSVGYVSLSFNPPPLPFL